MRLDAIRLSRLNERVQTRARGRAGVATGFLVRPRRSPSCSHSAHVGQEIVVRYRWHPYYGRRIRVHYSEQRASGCVVHFEIEAGVVAALPAWMFDASICASMSLGRPRVSTAVLCDLHRLLQARGFRRSSSGDLSAIQEPQDAPSVQGSQELPRSWPSVAAKGHGVRVSTDPELGRPETHQGHSTTGAPPDASGRHDDQGERP
jgi:hypothetical protein